ncbi:MAG: hypothetical protein U9N87_04465 [Planctomycetota bacterium]|nr:hypothetical protein [Planctomycetota bacterium]
MSQPVKFSFDCLPLRSITRFDVPIDAPAEMEAKIGRIRAAIKKHGNLNTYYLHNAKCVYHLSNSEDVGMLEFSFEGTVLTDQKDSKTLQCDLSANLERETCDWIAPRTIPKPPGFYRKRGDVSTRSSRNNSPKHLSPTCWKMYRGRIGPCTIYETPPW